MSQVVNHALLSEAAEWFAILQDENVTADERRRWQDWLAATPAHAQAWQRVESIGQPLSQIAHRAPLGAIRLALARSRVSGRRRTLQILGFGGMALGSGLLLRHTLPWQSWTHAYAVTRVAQRTAIGEQRQLTLDDGSTLAINTASAVDLDFGQNLRRIILHEGEILVESAPDKHSPPRPLVVDTPFGRLTALGTRFNVRSDQQGIQLAVFEGTVRIKLDTSGSHVDIAAGRQASFNSERIESDGPADPAREHWARGQLIADNIPLSLFVDELGRYTPIILSIDEAARQHRLLGVFRISDPAKDVPRILASLESVLPVRVQVATDKTVHISNR